MVAGAAEYLVTNNNWDQYQRWEEEAQSKNKHPQTKADARLRRLCIEAGLLYEGLAAGRSPRGKGEEKRVEEIREFRKKSRNKTCSTKRSWTGLHRGLS